MKKVVSTGVSLSVMSAKDVFNGLSEKTATTMREIVLRGEALPEFYKLPPIFKINIVRSAAGAFEAARDPNTHFELYTENVFETFMNGEFPHGLRGTKEMIEDLRDREDTQRYVLAMQCLRKAYDEFVAK
ncbi:MAG: hypothetical protein GC136_05385 [Alphaproteobacteria bacterium]|nr:hypothetical protein [Alphaproteobacteria bacterium]